VRYFYASYGDNPFLILRRDSYLFDRDVEHHLLLPIGHQTAWLRSAKEAVLVRKHHDDLAESSRKQWFKDFFIKKPTSLGHESASSSARPVTRTVNKSSKPESTKAQSLSMAITQTPRTDHPTFKPRLIKVKGCTRLFKYSHKPVLKTSSHTNTNPQKHSAHNRRMVIPQVNNRIAHYDNIPSANEKNDILWHPSGLKMPSLLHRKSMKLTRKVYLDKATKNKTKDRKSGRKNKDKVEAKYPLRGCLEAYGFKMSFP
jgi:hypothetical protein